MSSRLRPRTWTYLCAGLGLCLAGATSASAQQTGGGTLTGTVIDKDGVVPGATVTITAEATNTTRTTPTNEVGLFRFAGLAPGTYTIKVEVSGFKPVTVNDLLLTAGEIRDVGKLVLQVGGQTETVTVTAAVTPVQVETSARKVSSPPTSSPTSR